MIFKKKKTKEKHEVCEVKKSSHTWDNHEDLLDFGFYLTVFFFSRYLDFYKFLPQGGGGGGDKQ